MEISRVEMARRTWAEIRADDVFGRAAQLAYYFFLAFFPFLICVIASLSLFAKADRGRAVLMDLFARIFPPTTYQLINTTFIDIIKSSGPVKMSFGIVASLWSASMGISAVMDTLNAAYRIQETRSLIKQYAIAVGLTISFAVLAVFSLLIVIFGDRVARLSPPGSIMFVAWTIAQWPLTLALLLLALAITYHFAPNLPSREWEWITPGSVTGVALLVIVSIGLRIYVRFSGTYNAVYGSLSAVIVLLVGLYLGGVAILSGGSLNGVLRRLATERSVHD